LGEIDHKFDIAISTACPALDYIVVDNPSTAEKCIKYLRDKNIGIGKFLILEKQKHLEKYMDVNFKIFRRETRLFDLIKVYNTKFRVAFFSGLGNCLVTEKLDHAIKLAYSTDKTHPCKVVTLTGNLIAESGTITGGGMIKCTGRIILAKNYLNAHISQKYNISKIINKDNINYKMLILNFDYKFVNLKKISENSPIIFTRRLYSFIALKAILYLFNRKKKLHRLK